MKLYHGTKCQDIISFDFAHSKQNSDFGKGVYFTTNFQQAIEWSVKHSETGAVYECDVDFSGFNVRSFLSDQDENQLYVLYLCRIGLEEIVPDSVDDFEKADFVSGFLLDGSVSDFCEKADQFNQGDITFEEFRNRIKLYGKGKDQICVKTAGALDYINRSLRCIYLTEKTTNGINIVEKK